VAQPGANNENRNKTMMTWIPFPAIMFVPFVVQKTQMKS
jgi:hypothetical protein